MINEYIQQYERVQRFLLRLKNQNRSQIEYEDDIWAFFQNCWHLKDWIKNDTTISSSAREAVEGEVKNYNSLMIAADLANRSKHFDLTFIRLDANITKKSVTVYPPLLIHNSKKGEIALNGKCRSEYHYTITTQDKSEYDVLKVANKAVEDWDIVINKLGI